MYKGKKSNTFKTGLKIQPFFYPFLFINCQNIMQEKRNGNAKQVSIGKTVVFFFDGDIKVVI